MKVTLLFNSISNIMKFLLLKLHMFNTREYGFLSFNNFFKKINKIKNFDRRIAINNRKQCERFRKKRSRIKNKLPYHFIGHKQNKSTFFFMNFFYLKRDRGRGGRVRQRSEWYCGVLGVFLS